MKGKQFWWMISFLALAALLALLFFIVIPAHGNTLLFGHPMSCPVPGHGGPPCNMEKCKALDKDGKKTGSNCSKYCAKQCCLCSDACPKEQNQNSPNDEEYIVMGFGD